jgi:catechol 2,3-dioxygenase-like lactoylglutathione lyase family enzyme
MIAGGHTVIYCADVATSVRFYIETLGMKLVKELGPDLMFLDAGGGFEIALHKATATQKCGQKTHVGFCARGDFDETVGIYENRGIVFTIHRTERASLAYFTDPDGNQLHLWKLTSDSKNKLAAPALGLHGSHGSEDSGASHA